MAAICSTTTWHMFLFFSIALLLSSFGTALAQNDPAQQAFQTMQASQQAAEAAQEASRQALQNAQLASQQITAAQPVTNQSPTVPRHPGYGRADKPSFSPHPGTFKNSVRVTISDVSTPKAQIFYTLDGFTPALTSTPYTGPLLVSSTTKLRAIAKSPIYSASRVSDGNTSSIDKKYD